MKKGVFVLVIMIVILTGCEKMMHPEESSNNNIKSLKDLTSLISGVYGQLALYFKDYSDVIIKGDDINSSLDQVDTVCSRNSYNTANYYSWELLYKAIISLNTIIIQFDDISGLEKETAEVLAEAFFLRSYCYFQLTRIYGSIPLIDDIEIKYNKLLSSPLEVYQFIENDMKKAIKFLPRSNDEARIPFVTVHKGVAKAVLAEIYLNWAGYPIKDNGKYNDAANLAKEVIDSSMIYGFRLMEDYAYVWDSNHFYNAESVFSIYYSNSANYSSYSFEGLYYGLVRLQKAEYKYFLNYPIVGKVWFSFPQVEINFYNNYPKNYRKKITFHTKEYIVDHSPWSDGPIGHYVDYDTISICNFMSYRKFFYNPKLIHYDEFIGSYDTYYYVGMPKVYIYRFAHTLLTYAEAKAHLNQLDASAFEAVNKIRRRANNVNINSPSVYDLQPGLSAEQFIDSVVWERAWELCGEPEGRWFDLKRLEKVEELQNIRHPDEGGAPIFPVSKSDYWEQIPESDKDLNPNL